MKTPLINTIIVLILTVASVSFSADDLSVLTTPPDAPPPTDMMKNYLLDLAAQLNAKWLADYSERTTPDHISEYQKNLKDRFTEAIGGFPPRTPLNPRITGTIERKGYIVEKLIFESQPSHFVTALMFTPTDPHFTKPYPAVLVPAGHSELAKGYDLYQRTAALMALNGIAALAFDPIDQGERAQLLDENNKAPFWGTLSHTTVGVSSILLGQNTARFEIWDGIRAVDYLIWRSDIDPDKIGCTGNSGGGTQTAYLMALDDRILAAAPGCYITSFDRLLNTIGCQDSEQNIYAQLAFGMDHADYLMMHAPKPALICCATKDFFDISGTWSTYRYAKRLYTRMGFPERIDLAETDNTHGFNLELRQAAARWMARWLRGDDKPIIEPDDIELLTEEESLCTPKGQVMLLEGAKSVYDLNIDLENNLAEQRKQLWAAPDKHHPLQTVRTITKIRPLADLPVPDVEKTAAIQRDGYTIEKLILKPEKGIFLPALKFIPQTPTDSAPVLYLHEDGKGIDAAPGGPIENLVKQGTTVLALDIRGTGETKQSSQRYGTPFFGTDAQDVYAAYVMGRSFVAMRAEDILTAARYTADTSHPRHGTVELIAIGSIAVSALHAAALEPQLFDRVTLQNMLASWSSIVHNRTSNNQLINTVHGALKAYDLPDLVSALGDKVTVKNPLNPKGLLVEN